MNAARVPIVVLGAGPAGLGAALLLSRRREFEVTVLERQDSIGGNAGSFELDGQRVDYGSHRLHPACAPEILNDIRSMLGDELLDRPRHGRIRLRDRWVHFPLQPLDLALHLPPTFALGVMWDAISHSARTNDVDSFAGLLEKKLGPTICRDFYFPYAEKIWGLPPHEIDAEQARRRVSARSLAKIARKVLGAVPGVGRRRTGRFLYPRQGYGQICDAYRDAAVKGGASIELDSSVRAVEAQSQAELAVVVDGADGPRRLPAGQVLSTIPLTSLVRAIRPAAPADVLESARALRYRSMLLVYLVLGIDRFTEYDAHYFPGADVGITRLSEPKNYAMAGVPGMTVLCAELPCAPDDEYWKLSDEHLAELVIDSMARAGLSVRDEVRRIVTKRLTHAYPIYHRGYQGHLDRLDTWVAGIDGVLSIGRQGLFVHDNTHHTLAMAYGAVSCLRADGSVDRDRWAMERRRFEDHVVED
jgi:protoporphyrinogen oxidase